jgi:tetratricopeptide (TPR) repeat protein
MVDHDEGVPEGFDGANVGYGEEGAHRTRAPLSELIVPRNQFHWLLTAMECWIFSRTGRNLILGLPFLVCALALVGMLWWLRHASMAPILKQFEARYNQAVAADDLEAQELCLSGLMTYRPGNPEYRLRLGSFLVERGSTAAGLSYILSLAPDKTDGYAPARMWLVQQAMQEEPYLELDSEQIEGQLLRVVEMQEDNVDAHQMLAELYVNQKEWRLAEKHLVDAARARPELNLAVAKLKQTLGRSTESIREYALRAEQALTDRLSMNRFDAEVRIALVEAKLMLGQQTEARELLVAGLEAGDNDKLRRALSDFDLLVAERRLSESVVNRDVALQLALGALQLDAANPRAILMLARLQTMGAAIEPALLEPAIAYWTEQAQLPDVTPATRSLLSQALALGGQPYRAAQVLEPLLNQQPDLRLRYAALLKRAGKQQEATIVLDQLLAETRVIANENPQDMVAAARYAEVLMLARKLHDCAAFLRSFARDGAESRLPEDERLRHLYGIICIEIYDASTSDPAVLMDEDPLGLLTEAVQIPTTAGQAMDRLVRIAFSDGPDAARAVKLVDQFRAVADPNGRVLSLLGLYALQADDASRARSYLEQANAQARGRNIMILNNLAIALVRMDPRDPDRALQSVEQALVLSPEHPDLLSTRGEVFVALERWPEAAADLKKALKQRPNSIETHRLLIEVYTALSEPGQAEYHRRRVTELQGS